ncbi:MAG TPA: ABC transporter permease [Gammaproteobacteria bacterium]
MFSAMKRLLRHPGYFATLVLVMATGLGGALSLYGISDAVLFRPLNVENAETLVRVFSSDETLAKRDPWPRPVIRDYLGSNEAFEDVAHYADWPQVSYTAPGQEPMTLRSALVSGNFFDVVGVRPEQGRLLQRADDVEGAGIVGVLSYETWASRFNARPQIIGEPITLNDQPVTIVGIASPGFSGVSMARAPDVWLPVSSAVHMALPGMPTRAFLDSPNMVWLDAVARLAPGVTLEQARTALETARLAHGDGEAAWPPALAFHARDVAIDPRGERNVEIVSWILFGLVAVLLIVVCADAAGLMLVRAEAARAETGVRLGLGATRGRIAADMLRESLVIVLCAGAFALLFALLLSGWLQRNIGAELALPDERGALIFNVRVLAGFAGMLLVAALLSTFAPIRRMAATRLADVLRGARHGDARRALNVHDGLIVVQVGISVLLLTVSMMFVGALRDTLAIDPGFETTDRAVAWIRPVASSDGGEEYGNVLEVLRNDPRVDHAALAYSVPVSPSGWQISVQPQGYTSTPDENMQVDVNTISDDYFETMGIPVLRGHDFRPTQKSDAPLQVIVNAAFVERYWPKRDGTGMLLHDFQGSGEPAEVIAVVANSKQNSLRELPRPMIYRPYQIARMSMVGVIVKARSAVAGQNAIRDAVEKLPGFSITLTRSLQAHIDSLTQRDRAMTLLAVGSAVFATLLSIVGMYGVAAYAARQRQREIGIRYALGATRPQVARQFLRRGVIVASGGIVAGSLLTVFVSRYLAGAVAGVDQGNALAMLLAGLLFAVVALFANLVPVWRAANVAPMEVLRDE